MIRLFPKSLILQLSLLVMLSCQSKYPPEMVYIPGGEFTMGCDTSGDADESPAHSVIIKPFYIGKYEVTQEEWVRIMKKNPSQFKGNLHPVECVSWDDANMYIKRLNKITGNKYRLPTEAEWEYVAKSGYDTTIYSSNLSLIGWWEENSGAMTHQVGLLNPNKYGIYDITGNVHEWCADMYDSLAYAKFAGIIPYNTPSQKQEAVARGGNWISKKHFTRITNRNHAPLDYRNPTVGFRLAMDAE